MTRRYLLSSLVAFGAYSLVAPLLKLALTEVPSTTAVFLSNFVLFVLVGGLVAYRGRPLRPYLRQPHLGRLVVLGVLLTVALLTYYRALALGPVSVVVPIYGLFIALSSIVGMTVLGEDVTARKLAAIALGVVAIALMSI